MRVKLEKVSNGVALRTSEVVGVAQELPYIGEQFLMTAPPLESGDLRRVHTSRVVAIDDATKAPGTWTITFRTENSIYRLTRLPDVQ